MGKKIYMGDELTRILAKVQAGENFALIRNGDGEKGLMLGSAFFAQEGWHCDNRMTRLGEALRYSISIDDPRYIIGVSCPCCDISAYQWYIENIKSSNLTFANLWVNSNYPEFIRRFKELERDAIVIANHRVKDKPIGKLNILDYYCVSDDCVSFWEQEAEEMIQRIIREHGNESDLLYVVSVGPMSGPIISRLFRNNPDNCYLDFGSAIDSFYWGKVTRPYMKPGTSYAKQKCWMYDPTGNNAAIRRKIEALRKKNVRDIKRKEFFAGIPTLPQRAARRIFGDNVIESIKRKLTGKGE